MSVRRRYIICYDITDPKRLYRTAKVCESYGYRIQFSVFESALDSMMLAKLCADLENIIHHDDDQILIIDLGRDDSSTPFHITSLGVPYIKKSRITII